MRKPPNRGSAGAGGSENERGSWAQGSGGGERYAVLAWCSAAVAQSQPPGDLAFVVSGRHRLCQGLSSICIDLQQHRLILTPYRDRVKKARAVIWITSTVTPPSLGEVMHGGLLEAARRPTMHSTPPSPASRIPANLVGLICFAFFGVGGPGRLLPCHPRTLPSPRRQFRLPGNDRRSN